MSNFKKRILIWLNVMSFFLYFWLYSHIKPHLRYMMCKYIFSFCFMWIPWWIPGYLLSKIFFPVICKNFLFHTNKWGKLSNVDFSTFAALQNLIAPDNNACRHVFFSHHFKKALERCFSSFFFPKILANNISQRISFIAVGGLKIFT